jgi:hypothetical protein
MRGRMKCLGSLEEYGKNLSIALVHQCADDWNCLPAGSENDIWQRFFKQVPYDSWIGGPIGGQSPPNPSWLDLLNFNLKI